MEAAAGFSVIHCVSYSETLWVIFFSFVLGNDDRAPRAGRPPRLIGLVGSALQRALIVTGPLRFGLGFQTSLFRLLFRGRVVRRFTRGGSTPLAFGRKVRVDEARTIPVCLEHGEYRRRDSTSRQNALLIMYLPYLDWNLLSKLTALVIPHRCANFLEDHGP